MQSKMQDEGAAKIGNWLASRDAQGRGRQVNGDRRQLLQQRRLRRPWNDTTCTKGKHNKAASESEGAFDVNVGEPDPIAAAPAITACVYVPKATAPAHHAAAGLNNTGSSLHLLFAVHLLRLCSAAAPQATACLRQPTAMTMLTQAQPAHVTYPNTPPTFHMLSRLYRPVSYSTGGWLSASSGLLMFWSSATRVLLTMPRGSRLVRRCSSRSWTWGT